MLTAEQLQDMRQRTLCVVTGDLIGDVERIGFLLAEYDLLRAELEHLRNFPGLTAANRSYLISRAHSTATIIPKRQFELDTESIKILLDLAAYQALLIRDLQQESEAYQRGFRDGREAAMKECLEISRMKYMPANL